MIERPLDGYRILLVEDEFFLVQELVETFELLGAEIVGPAARLSEALGLAKSAQLDGAVLDINLRGENVFPVADALLDRNVPFLFATGYDTDVIPQRYQSMGRCQKPVDAATVAKALLRRAVAPARTRSRC